jgi:regulator of sigma E protease
MIIVNIIIGLIGLGIMVFVHELGHLIAAKLAGIKVEAFSLGWGRKLVGFEYKGTEYRISVFPIGGYCKMKGEEVLRSAWEEGRKKIPKEPGAFYSAAPLHRIGVALAGPTVNFVFAVLLLSLVWFVGYQIQTFENRIVLQDDYQEVLADSEDAMPASKAGLQSGDTVVRIDGREIETYRDIREAVAAAPDKEMEFTVERDGQRITTTVTPILDPETGAGRIGVYPWIDPIVESVDSGSPADVAGIRPGDRIVSAAGEPVENSLDFVQAVDNNPTGLDIRLRREEGRTTVHVIPTVGENGVARVGVAFETVTVSTPEYGVFGAIGRGAEEAVQTLVLAVRSIGLLFRGVDLTSAVAGPVRITYLIGEVATEGFSEGVGQGFSYVFNFLALLSVILFFMNLLPIPALDGGQILLFLWEMISGRDLRPKAVYRYQLIGTVLILAILVFAILGDVVFLIQG